MNDPVPTPVSRDAATLIVLREGGIGPPDILMVQRAATMAFAAGALVFPGGALDPDDHVLARKLGADMPLDEAASRIGAIRETLEESGIAPGLAVTDGQVLAEMRRALERGVVFSQLLDAGGLLLDLDALIPFTRWHPNPAETARHIFDTRFYVARYDPAGPEASVDDTEHVDLFWASAGAVIDRCTAGQGHVIYPTRRNLERLAQFDSIAAVEDHARATRFEKIIPWMEDRVDGRYLCIPKDAGYPITEEPIVTALRG